MSTNQVFLGHDLGQTAGTALTVSQPVSGKAHALNGALGVIADATSTHVLTDQWGRLLTGGFSTPRPVGAIISSNIIPAAGQITLAGSAVNLMAAPAVGFRHIITALTITVSVAAAPAFQTLTIATGGVTLVNHRLFVTVGAAYELDFSSCPIVCANVTSATIAGIAATIFVNVYGYTVSHA